jgi:transposase
MAREILTDEQWERIAPLLPPQRPKTGRPAKDHRTVVEAILWIDRTGAPWRDLPREFGPWQSIATRFYRWVEAGVWDHVLAELQRQADASGELDWELHHVDGTSIRAHQHAAGAQKGEPYTVQQNQQKIRKIQRPSGEAGEDSPPRSIYEPKATASP